VPSLTPESWNYTSHVTVSKYSSNFIYITICTCIYMYMYIYILAMRRYMDNSTTPKIVCTDIHQKLHTTYIKTNLQYISTEIPEGFHIYIYIFVYIYIYIYTYIYIFIIRYRYLCRLIYVYVYVYVNVYTYICIIRYSYPCRRLSISQNLIYRSLFMYISVCFDIFPLTSDARSALFRPINRVRLRVGGR